MKFSNVRNPVIHDLQYRTSSTCHSSLVTQTTVSWQKVTQTCCFVPCCAEASQHIKIQTNLIVGHFWNHDSCSRPARSRCETARRPSSPGPWLPAQAARVAPTQWRSFGFIIQLLLTPKIFIVLHFQCCIHYDLDEDASFKQQLMLVSQSCAGKHKLTE